MTKRRELLDSARHKLRLAEYHGRNDCTCSNRIRQRRKQPRRLALLGGVRRGYSRAGLPALLVDPQVLSRIGRVGGWVLQQPVWVGTAGDLSRETANPSLAGTLV